MKLISPSPWLLFQQERVCLGITGLCTIIQAGRCLSLEFYWEKSPTFVANTLFWGACNWRSEQLALSSVLGCVLLSIEALVWKKKTPTEHRKKGIVQCESCVYDITVMSGLNCFLIVCFYATIVFPCLSFSRCVCNVSEPMQLAIYIPQREQRWNKDHFQGRVGARGRWLGFSAWKAGDNFLSSLWI